MGNEVLVILLIMMFVLCYWLPIFYACKLDRQERHKVLDKLETILGGHSRVRWLWSDRTIDFVYEGMEFQIVYFWPGNFWTHRLAQNKYDEAIVLCTKKKLPEFSLRLLGKSEEGVFHRLLYKTPSLLFSNFVKDIPLSFDAEIYKEVSVYSDSEKLAKSIVYDAVGLNIFRNYDFYLLWIDKGIIYLRFTLGKDLFLSLKDNPESIKKHLENLRNMFLLVRK